MNRLKAYLKKNPFARLLYRKTRQGIEYAYFIKNYILFKKRSKDDKRFRIAWKKRRPVLFENTEKTSFDSHYIYQVAWASRIVAQTRPQKHIDISSTLYFSSSISAFVPFEFYDYRPAALALDNLSCGKADLNALPFEDGSIASLSCMHTVEHIGLGRYGDPIDPRGDINAMAELARVLAPGGNLLFVVPVGRPLIQFNAHRIYAYSQIIESFKGLALEKLSLVTDRGEFLAEAQEKECDRQKYGCGMFWLKKR